MSWKTVLHVSPKQVAATMSRYSRQKSSRSSMGRSRIGGRRMGILGCEVSADLEMWALSVVTGTGWSS